MFPMHPDKYPIPDGYNASCYQHFGISAVMIFSVNVIVG